jgi:two-component system, LuxR family, sensor kinase FixL
MFKAAKYFLLKYKLFAGFAVAMFFLSISGFFGYFAITNLIATSNEVVQSHRLIKLEEELMLKVSEAEAGFLGYAITGDQKFLRAHQEAASQIKILITQVRAMIPGRVEKRQELEVLAKLIAQQQQAMQRGIEVRISKGFEGVSTWVRQKDTETIMRSIRNLHELMTHDEEALLKEKENASKDRSKQTIHFNLSFGILSLGIMGLIFLLLYRENTRRKASEKLLLQGKECLEDQIDERTRNLVTANEALQLKIKERQISEDALRESQARLQAIIHTAVEGIVTIDDRGIMESINPSAEKIFGYQSSEVLGKNVSILMPSPHRELHDRYIAAYLKSGQKKVIGVGREVVGQRKDGSIFDLELSVGEMHIGNRRLFTGILRDISSRKRAEQKVKELARTLIEKNKELETFAYVASHDLQEPVRTNINCMKILDRDYHDKFNPEGKKLLQFAVESSQRMSLLIADLLDYSRARKNSLDARPTDCEQLLKSVLSTLNGSLEGSGVVITHDPLPTITADESQLSRVFQNLLSNAIKFAPPQKGKIHISVKEDEKEWIFSVKDNGIGIEPIYFEQIFTMFRQLHTKQEYPGSGMGLAICKQIVQKHGGKIWVESTLGEGSTFHFSLSRQLQQIPEPLP